MSYKSLPIYNLFSECLYSWNKTNDRILPWKNEKNPYFIWLSEIILQQTRVEQGLPYFERFVKLFPKVNDLANTSEDDVLKQWQGLGYYSRARNLHFTAKYITNELNGEFPKTYKKIRALKGVGDYTAAAIASFAYDLPHAVVDGNVYRVLARAFGIETPIDSTLGKKKFSLLANELIDKADPGKYNQAIMDFGATHCKPKNPQCSSCPFSKYCIAFKEERIALLPVKSKKGKKIDRFFHYLIIKQSNSIYLTKRSQKDIWLGLYEFPLIEKDKILTVKELKETKEWKNIFGHSSLIVDFNSKTYRQTLSHQYINAVFIEVSLNTIINPGIPGMQEVKQINIQNFAFPKIITWFLTDKSLYLNFN